MLSEMGFAETKHKLAIKAYASQIFIKHFYF